MRTKLEAVKKGPRAVVEIGQDAHGKPCARVSVDGHPIAVFGGADGPAIMSQLGMALISVAALLGTPPPTLREIADARESSLVVPREPIILAPEAS